MCFHSARNRPAPPQGFEIGADYSGRRLNCNVALAAGSGRSGTTRFRFNGYLPDGSRVLIRMNKNNNGFWKMSLTHARLTLPVATDFNILVSGVFGTDLVASQRTFELKRSKPGSQKLFFRGISTGGM